MNAGGLPQRLGCSSRAVFRRINWARPSPPILQPFGKRRLHCITAILILFLHAFQLKHVLLHFILCAFTWNKRSLHLARYLLLRASTRTCSTSSVMHFLWCIWDRSNDTARLHRQSGKLACNDGESSVIGYILRASNVGEVSRGVSFGQFSTYQFLDGGLIGWSERISLGSPQTLSLGRTLWVVGKNIAWVILLCTRVCQSSNAPSR